MIPVTLLGPALGRGGRVLAPISKKSLRAVRAIFDDAFHAQRHLVGGVLHGTEGAHDLLGLFAESGPHGSTK